MGTRATGRFFKRKGKKHGAFFQNEGLIQYVALSRCGSTIPYQFSEVVRGSISGA